MPGADNDNGAVVVDSPETSVVAVPGAVTAVSPTDRLPLNPDSDACEERMWYTCRACCARRARRRSTALPATRPEANDSGPNAGFTINRPWRTFIADPIFTASQLSAAVQSPVVAAFMFAREERRVVQRVDDANADVESVIRTVRCWIAAESGRGGIERRRSSVHGTTILLGAHPDRCRRRRSLRRRIVATAFVPNSVAS